MWLQAVAIVLPRVQRHYGSFLFYTFVQSPHIWIFPEISDRSIGFMSSAVHAGMMVGALGWGTCESSISEDFLTTLIPSSRFGSFGTNNCIQWDTFLDVTLRSCL